MLFHFNYFLPRKLVQIKTFREKKTCSVFRSVNMIQPSGSHRNVHLQSINYFYCTAFKNNMKHSQGPESQTDSYSGSLSNLMTTTAADPLHKIHTLTEFVKVHYNITSFDFDNCYSNVKASSSPPYFGLQNPRLQQWCISHLSKLIISCYLVSNTNVRHCHRHIYTQVKQRFGIWQKILYK